MAQTINMNSAALERIARAVDQYDDSLFQQWRNIETGFGELHWGDQNAQSFRTAYMEPLGDALAAVRRKIDQDLRPMLATLYARVRAYEEQGR